jgi:putative RNA 2'-phosphotransferase
MGINLIDLSRLVSHALRHEPWLYELEIDSEGWTSIDALINSLRLQGGNWEKLTEMDMTMMVNSSSKRRHEIADGRIRALYGHSLAQKLQKTEAIPPDILFHGTSPEVYEIVKSEGLKPMQRQYIHLATNQDMAYQVGRRKVEVPTVLVIASKQAHSCGIKFYSGNDMVWLSNYIPPEFISECEVAPYDFNS